MKVEVITAPRNPMISVAKFVIRYLLFLPFDLFLFPFSFRLDSVFIVVEFCL